MLLPCIKPFREFSLPIKKNKSLSHPKMPVIWPLLNPSSLPDLTSYYSSCHPTTLLCSSNLPLAVFSNGSLFFLDPSWLTSCRLPLSPTTTEASSTTQSTLTDFTVPHISLFHFLYYIFKGLKLSCLLICFLVFQLECNFISTETFSIFFTAESQFPEQRLANYFL